MDQLFHLKNVLHFGLTKSVNGLDISMTNIIHVSVRWGLWKDFPNFHISRVSLQLLAV